MLSLLVTTMVMTASASPAAPPGAAPRPAVLVIGDSHAATTFGRALDLLLRSLDVEVTTVGSCGVSPDAFLRGLAAQCGYLQIETGEPDWIVVKRRQAKTPRLHELLAETRPELTVVELGANQIHTAWRDPDGAAADIADVADAILESGSECLWVGPPAGRDAVKPHDKIEHLYGILGRALAGRCRLVDSRPAALPFLDYERLAPSAGDGRHWDAIGITGQQAARRWALEVFRVAEVMLKERGTRAPDPASTTVLRAVAPSSSGRGLDLRFRHRIERLEGGRSAVGLEPAGSLGEARAIDEPALEEAALEEAALEEAALEEAALEEAALEGLVRPAPAPRPETARVGL